MYVYPVFFNVYSSSSFSFRHTDTQSQMPLITLYPRTGLVNYEWNPVFVTYLKLDVTVLHFRRTTWRHRLTWQYRWTITAGAVALTWINYTSYTNWKTWAVILTCIRRQVLQLITLWPWGLIYKMSYGRITAGIRQSYNRHQIYYTAYEYRKFIAKIWDEIV